MKKVSKVLLTAVLAAAVAGCSGSGSADTSKDHLARIKEAGVLKVGLEGDWQPFSYETADGELVGYDVEVAQGIAEYLGVKIEITPTPWDGLFLAMESDVIDMVVNGVDITEERSKTYDFSDPYAYDHTVLIVRDDNTEIKSFEDLKGKKTANSIGSTYMELGEQYGDILRHPGNNVDAQDDGNTVSDPVDGDLFTDPHQEGTSCGESSNDHDDIQGIELFQKSLTSESDRHCRTFKQCKSYCQITGDVCNFLSSVFSFFLQFLKFRKCDRQELNDNGCSNIYCNVKCEYGHGTE